jgi:hypothetical protein
MLKESTFFGRRLATCLLVILAGWLSVLATLMGVSAADTDQEIPAATLAGNTPISYGDLVTGTISAISQTVDYTFDGVNGEYAFIRVIDVFSSSLSPAITVYGPGGIDLGGGSGADFVVVSLLLEATGTYTVQVKDDTNSATGSFRLYLQRTREPVNASPAILGEILSDSIDLPPETNGYTVTVEASTLLIARVLDSSVSPFGPQLKLFAPNGDFLCSTQGTNFLQLLCNIESGGAHSIFIGDMNGVGVGSYHFYLQRTVNPANATPIYYGQLLFDAIEVRPEMKAYTLNGTAGRQVQVTVIDSNDSSFDPEIQVYKPDGFQLCDDWDELTAMVECQLEVSGTYTILVGDYGGEDTGSFAVGISGFAIYLPVITVK